MATRFTGRRRIHQMPRPARRTCSFTALASRREPRDPDQWSRVQPSGDHSGPARRVVWDMSCKCPDAAGFLFRAARRYAEGAGARASAGTRVSLSKLSSCASTPAALDGRRSRPFSSPTAIGRSWATESFESFAACRIDCGPCGPRDVCSPASVRSDCGMIRFRRETGRIRCPQRVVPFR